MDRLRRPQELARGRGVAGNRRHPRGEPPGNTERAIRRFIERAGDPSTLAVAYEAGPCGYEIYRLLSTMGVACDVIAPSLTPIRAGDRVKTDRRDAEKLVRLYRAGELGFVSPPTHRHERLSAKKSTAP